MTNKSWSDYEVNFNDSCYCEEEKVEKKLVLPELEPTFSDLIAFGFAPGKYTRICADCHKSPMTCDEMEFCDKHSTRCRQCATIAFKKHILETLSQPLENASKIEYISKLVIKTLRSDDKSAQTALENFIELASRIK